MDVESRPGIFAPTQTDTQYLHQSGATIYIAEKRSRNDVCFTVSYVLLAALTLFWGIAAFVHKDPNAALYTNNFFVMSTTCDIEHYRAVHAGDYSDFFGSNALPHKYYGRDEDDATRPDDNDSTPGRPGTDGAVIVEDYGSTDNLTDEATFSKYFKEAISIWFPISAAFAVGFSVVYLILFRRFAKAMVIVAIGFSLSFTLALGIFSFMEGVHFMGAILIVTALAFGVFYWCIRRKLELCADLLGLSARSLYENGWLMPTAIIIKLLGLGILAYSFAAIIHAAEVGSPKANSAVTEMVVNDDESAACFDKNTYLVACCTYQIKGWAAAYAFFCAVFICWTASLILEIKLFTVADTIAQWYFSAPAAGAAETSALMGTGNSGRSNLTRGSVRLALRHCLVDSFGSVAFAAAIIAIIDFIRAVLRRAARRNIFCCIVNLIAQPILALMEKFTRFATITTAITGQAFVPAARTVFETLRRNFLQTYTMWWVPDFVLRSWVFLVSLSWAAVVMGSTYGITKNKDNPVKWGIPLVTAFLTFLLVCFILRFMTGMLLDAVNTLYICYAMDKDMRRVTHPEIHNMFSKIPGLAVENPDGNIMYGAPDAAQQPQVQLQQQAQAQPYLGAFPVPQPYVYPAVQQQYTFPAAKEGGTVAAPPAPQGAKELETTPLTKGSDTV